MLCLLLWLMPVRCRAEAATTRAQVDAALGDVLDGLDFSGLADVSIPGPGGGGSVEEVVRALAAGGTISA